MVVGLAMMMTLPLIVLFYQQTENLNTGIIDSQVDKVASEIRDAADEVYYLGHPSKKTVTVFFPEGINSILIYNTSIVFLVESVNGDYEVVKWSVANLSGTLQTYPGIHHVVVEAQSGYVSISD